MFNDPGKFVELFLVDWNHSGVPRKNVKVKK